jgi:hypothetical protein
MLESSFIFHSFKGYGLKYQFTTHEPSILAVTSSFGLPSMCLFIAPYASKVVLEYQMYGDVKICTMEDVVMVRLSPHHSPPLLPKQQQQQI